MSVDREITGPDSYVLHIPGLHAPDVTSVLAPDEARRIVDDIRASILDDTALCDEIEALLGEPANCSRCKAAFTDELDGLCHGCRDWADGLRVVKP